jgi:putative two-component system response regulator
MEPKGTILIVDDEVGPRESLRMILKPHFAIFVAADGKEALSILRKEKIDVVTLDLKMPGLSGLDTLREIRRFFSDVEVVIITAYGSPQNVKEANRYGARSFICKPFNAMELLNYINNLFERRSYALKAKNQSKYNSLLTRE